MRKVKISILFVLSSLLWVSCSAEKPVQPVPEPVVEPVPEPPPEPEPQPEPVAGVSIFLDTDLGIDIDDAGALAVLHTLADRGEATVLATVSNVYDPYAAAAIDAVNTYYGHPDIPIGHNPNPEHYPVATPYWRTDLVYAHFVEKMAEFPNDTDLSSIRPAAQVYREVLAAQPDGSVTVLSLGFMQNMADLLASGPDEYSPLNGADLIRQKVKVLIAMSGFYPSHDGELYLEGGKEMDETAARAVLEDWPTPIVFSPGNDEVCNTLNNGATLSEQTPPANPVREGYNLFNGPGRGRTSWDLCAVLYAVRGLSDPQDGTYFKLADKKERLTLNADGESAWVPDQNSRHERMLRVMSEEKLERILEALLVAPPSQ